MYSIRIRSGTRNIQPFVLIQRLPFHPTGDPPLGSHPHPPHERNYPRVSLKRTVQTILMPPPSLTSASYSQRLSEGDVRARQGTSDWLTASTHSRAPRTPVGQNGAPGGLITVTVMPHHPQAHLPCRPPLTGIRQIPEPSNVQYGSFVCLTHF